MNSFIEFFQESFMHVAPIVVAGVVAIAIILERYRALFLIYPIRNENAFFERIKDLVMDGKIAEAVAACENNSSKPAAVVVKKALLRAHQPESLIENGLELAVEEASQKIQKRTQFLSMIANVATLLGLLGTIVGLVTSFEAIGTADAAQRTSLLAKGISQAMHATMLGLGVAVPCMVAFSMLMNRTNVLISEVETSAVRILDIIKQRYFESEMKLLKGNPFDKGVA